MLSLASSFPACCIQKLLAIHMCSGNDKITTMFYPSLIWNSIERIPLSFCVMWIYGLQAQTKSNSERFLRLLSCCRHYAVTAWILRHLKLFDRFFTCDVARFMQWLHWITQCLQQLKSLKNLSDLLFGLCLQTIDSHHTDNHKGSFYGL